MLMIVNVLSTCLLGMLPNGMVGNSAVSLLQCCRAVDFCTEICSVCTCRGRQCSNYSSTQACKRLFQRLPFPSISFSKPVRQ